MFVACQVGRALLHGRRPQVLPSTPSLLINIRGPFMMTGAPFTSKGPPTMENLLPPGERQGWVGTAPPGPHGYGYTPGAAACWLRGRRNEMAEGMGDMGRRTVCRLALTEDEESQSLKEDVMVGLAEEIRTAVRLRGRREWREGEGERGERVIESENVMLVG